MNNIELSQNLYLFNLKKANNSINENEENHEYSLSLRKKKNESKILQFRLGNNKNSVLQKSIIQQIKIQFNELLINKNNNSNLLLILKDLSQNFQKLISFPLEDIILENISVLLDYEFIQKIISQIYQNIISINLIEESEVINNYLLIYCSLLWVCNNFDQKKETCIKIKELFISQKDYINLYISLLKINDKNIIYNIYKFIGLLLECRISFNNIKKLYMSNFIDEIIKNASFDNDITILEIKIWCLSLFGLRKEFAININLSNNIQQFYLNIFNNIIIPNYSKHSKILTEKFLYNYIKLIANTSNCNDNDYINKILENNILNFITKVTFNEISNELLIKQVLIIIGNMNYTNDKEIVIKIYNTNDIIEYLIDIISNVKSSVNNINLALWVINNFLENKEICIQIFYKKKLFSIYKKLVYDNERILTEDNLNEICLSFQYLWNFANKSQKNFIIVKFDLMKLLITGFKKLCTVKYSSNLYSNFIELIYVLLTLRNKELVWLNKLTFEKEGGREFVLDKIIEIFNEFIGQLSNEDIQILVRIDYIKKYLLINDDCYEK